LRLHGRDIFGLGVALLRLRQSRLSALEAGARTGDLELQVAIVQFGQFLSDLNRVTFLDQHFGHRAAHLEGEIEGLFSRHAAAACNHRGEVLPNDRDGGLPGRRGGLASAVDEECGEDRHNDENDADRDPAARKFLAPG